MNSFDTIESKNWHVLTIDNYEEKTHKKHPYFQVVDGKSKHFAICPSCGNPIQIINLYPSKYNPGKIYARHYPKSVIGIAKYDQLKYENCDLSSKKSYDSGKKNTSDKDKKNYIIDIVEKHSDIIKYFIKRIIGIKITSNLFSKLINKFIQEEGYYFLFVSPNNLPYSILYLSGNHNLFMQRVNEDSKDLIDSVNKSNSFKVNEEGRIVKKKENEYATIQIYFTEYRNGSKEGSSGSILLVIDEEFNFQTSRVYSKRINIDIEHFARTVAKKERGNKAF